MEKTIKPKVIIIMGTGASVTQCDFEADEVWGVNGTYTLINVMPADKKQYFRTDKLFLTDTLFSHERGSLNFDIDAMNEFAKKYNCELITLNEMKLGKHTMNATPYPYKKVVKYFHSDYFTDTICYMIAYALYTHSCLACSPEGVIRPELKQPLKIKFFGIDMSTTREYGQSKAGVEYWLGIGYGMGIEFENSQGSVILMHPQGVPYGKWDLMKKNTRINKKSIDPFGLLDGKKNPTTQDADNLEVKIAKEMGRDMLKEARL